MVSKKQYYTIKIIIEGDIKDAHDIQKWLDDRVDNIRGTPEFPPVLVDKIEKQPSKAERIVRVAGPILALLMVGLPIAKIVGLDISWELAAAPIWGTVGFFIMLVFSWYTMYLANSLLGKLFGNKK